MVEMCDGVINEPMGWAKRAADQAQGGGALERRGQPRGTHGASNGTVGTFDHLSERQHQAVFNKRERTSGKSSD